MDRQNRLFQYIPYPWQKNFHDAGATNSQRMVRAANRTGKTHSAGAEVAMHATGEYPEWWDGRRFPGPILIWVGSVTNEASRDIVQKELLGGLGQDLGTGMIPRRHIYGRPKMRQAGISDVVDTIDVRHRAGGRSKIVFKTYDQGWRKWQGTAPHVIWLDEEPDSTAANEKRIFSEALTRILSTQGLLMVTFTPLLGETDLVRHFNKGLQGTWVVTATWDQAPHLDEGMKAELLSSYDEHEIDARTKGVPILGEGRVFKIREEDIRCEPFETPAYYAQIVGIDFGIDHPFGYARIAWDRDADIIYLIDCFKVRDKDSIYHAAAIRQRGERIPVAWPHDGMNKEAGSGKKLYRYYAEQGVRMLPKSACYPPNPGEQEKLGRQPVEPIVMEMTERMKTGRFKAFSQCQDFFEEFRTYHRKDGKINPIHDDVLKATFYAVMMKRYAARSFAKKRQMPLQPIMRAARVA